MKLSIITVVYKNLTGLRVTGASIAVQKCRDFEWIVIDGGSDDGTKEYLSTSGQAPSYWVSERDKGIYDAMNKGLRAAHGEYVLFLNAGDRIADENGLSNLMSGQLTADVVFGDLNFVFPDHVEVHRYDYAINQRNLIDFGIPHPAALIRRTTILAYGGYDPTLGIVSDWKLWLQFFKDGRTFEHRSVVFADFLTGGTSFQRLDQAKAERRKVLNEVLGRPKDPAARHHVLFVINQLNKGGAETSLVNFINALVDDGYEVDLVVYDHHESDKVVSLLGKLSKRVTVCTGNSVLISSQVVEFLKRRRYDAAISVGEWHTPEFVMRYAQADKKAIWIHADVTSSSIPKTFDLFDYDRETDAWICVSNYQCGILRKHVPFLTGEFIAIHNPVDRTAIEKAAQENVDLPKLPSACKIIVMVGNFRVAKNYLRAVDVAGELHGLGCDAAWIICGDLNYREYVENVRRRIRAKGLQDRFFLLGAVSNPWKYMSRADAVVSTSDSESWCMTITEAKILGKPVVATSTGGACEQIADGVDGYLCGFDAKVMANRLRSLFEGKSALSGGKACDAGIDPVSTFKKWVDAPHWARQTASVVFVIDDANFRGGAHVATERLIRKLDEVGVHCDVLSLQPPSDNTRMRFSPAIIRMAEPIPALKAFCLYGFRDFTRLPGVPLRRKLEKLWFSIRRRVSRKFDEQCRNSWIEDGVSRVLREYQTVVVLAESSRLRELVSQLPSSVRKVQLCHTFYTQWRDSSTLSRQTCENDRSVYARMDAIGLIGKLNAEDFARVYPELKDKIHPFYNIMDIGTAKGKFHEVKSLVHLITVARIEADKDILRIVRIAARLKDAGLSFCWDVYGDGPLRTQMQDEISKCGLESVLRMCGYSNCVCEKIAASDLFVLLSHFEGLPNVIYESLAVGTPVFATNVGGIAEQVADGVTGKLVPDDDEVIVSTLKETLENPPRIDEWRKELTSYTYDNAAALAGFRKLIGQ